MKPTAILEKLCKNNKLAPPVYKPDNVYVGGHTFYGSGQVELEGGTGRFDNFGLIMLLY